jgi:hypothetical protein
MILRFRAPLHLWYPFPLSYAIGNGKAKIILIKTEAVAVFYSHFTKTNAITTAIVFTTSCPYLSTIAVPAHGWAVQKTVFPSQFLPKSNSYSKIIIHTASTIESLVVFGKIRLLRHLLKVCNHLSSYILRIGTNSVICNSVISRKQPD